MSDGTKIEWAANADGTPGATWNPIRARTPAGKVGWFCVHASHGCKFCYAEAINRRLGTGVDYKAQNAEEVEVFLDERTLTQPLRWKKPRTIFPCSMSDLFGEFVTDAMIDRVFAVMALCPQHTFIVLTKRATRMNRHLRDVDCEARFKQALRDLAIPRAMELHWPLPNVWLGVSVEDQANADKRIPDLLATPAAVRFVSAEPLLGPIDLSHYLHGIEEHGVDMTRDAGSRVGGCVGWTPPLDWIIVGGESGGNARPMHPDWARTIRDQCADSDAAFFFKQWGEWAPVDYRSDDGSRRFINMGDRKEPIVLRNPNERDTAARVAGAVNVKRVGKKAAGRLLDGVEHNARPIIKGD